MDISGKKRQREELKKKRKKRKETKRNETSISGVIYALLLLQEVKL